MRETDIAWAFLPGSQEIGECIHLKALGQSATLITVEQIRNMDPEEVNDCLEDIGRIQTWSSEQREAWLDRVKSVNIA